MSESHLRYDCQIWGQRSYHKLSHIANLQGKGNRIISFQKVINTCRATFQRNKNCDTK